MPMTSTIRRWPLQKRTTMDFDIVILDESIDAYPQISWKKWKDYVREQMISQGDQWSMATLPGNDIWNCLDSHQINPAHLVQWKPTEDTLYKVSLPDHPHPFDTPL